MIKILHAADLHLDAPLQGWNEMQTQSLRQSLQQIPGQLAAICRREHCQMMLLSGDLFDGAYTAGSLGVLKQALEEAAVPVFITPGNHDFVSAASPWLTETFPPNVHVFTRPVMESVYVEDLDCTVYGAGFVSMDCPGLLQDFHAPAGQLSIGILHGDPTQVSSPYCPITQSQVAASGLAYLALGHIHKGGQFQAGNTLCAWPGCTMGKGYDETGEKGVLIAEVGDTVTARFVPLGTPRFFDLECTPGDLESLLPPVGNGDFYRITLIGESEKPDLAALSATYSRFPNLVLRDRTVTPVDVWKSLGEDSFEGTFFRLLHEALEGKPEEAQQTVRLSAKICRQILDGQEVVLP